VWRLRLERDQIIEKIRKLLKLSESPNEHEAVLAATKVRELLSTYNISLSDLSIEDLSRKFGIIEILTLNSFNLEEWVCSLAFHVSRIFDCRAIMKGSDSGQIAFVGIPSDAEVVVYVFEFLRRRLEEMSMGAVRTRREEIRGIDEETYRQTYLIGAVQRLREILVVKSLVFKKREQDECKSLVCYKKENLDQYFEEKYPHLETSQSGLIELDRESFYRGYEQAKVISIEQAIGDERRSPQP
jgi:hypothetical protein